MVTVKVIENGAVQPKPRYGHLSALNPEYTLIKDAIDKDFNALWALPMEEFVEAWRVAPPALLDDSPVIGKDIVVEHMKVPVRDGAMVEIRIYKSITPVPNALLNLNTHGGGWTVGSPTTEEGQNRMVAAIHKAVVVSVNYRMAPGYRFPYAVNDSFDVLKWCKSNALALGINPEMIILSGGSSGANIAAALAQKTLNEKVTGVIGQVLNIPVTCHPKHFPEDEFEYGSFQQNASASVVDQPRMMWFWDQYLPNAEPDVYASPLIAKDFNGLPPALIQIAGADPLRDEGFAYADKLIRAGVRTTVKVYPGLPHGFYFFLQLKEARQYLQEISFFIRSLQLP